MKPQVGDLVLYQHPDESCGVCFFCANKSSNIGVVINTWDAQGPEPNFGMAVIFDAGEWTFRDYDLGEIKILSQS